MNTNRTGMRTLLAAAAAGALIMGSAAGAMAAPKEKAAPTPYMQVRMVNVHNGYVNINSEATARKIKVKANVWDSAKNSKPDSLTFTLAQYNEKGDDNKILAPATTVLDPLTIGLDTKAPKDKKSKNYYGALDVYAAIVALGEAEAAKAMQAIAEAPILLCLDGVDLVEPAGLTEKPFKKQVDKKIGTDCVKIVNIAPK